MRPTSIVQFEIVYLLAVAVKALTSVLLFDVARAAIAANPAASGIGDAMLYGGTAFSIIVGMLLWYFTARARSVVAKWIIVVFFTLSVLGVLITLVRHIQQPGLAGVLNIVGIVLSAVAVWLLFRPDAKAWFGERAVTMTEDGDHIA